MRERLSTGQNNAPPPRTEEAQPHQQPSPRDAAQHDRVGPRYSKRNGGYLRILKYGFRKGDNAPMALVELLDRPEPEEEAKAKDAKA